MPPEFTDASRGIRLQKALANLGVASRRDCEQLVASGRVSVNGQRITGLPAWVDPAKDRIEVDGSSIARPGHGGAPAIYLMLNKPRGVISTCDDPEDRRTVLALIPAEILPPHARLFPVGRLDAESTGLILLTNDGELANRLTHPRYGVTKQYQVSVRGRVEQADVEKLSSGLYLAQRDRKSRSRASKKAVMEEIRIAGYERDRERGDRTLLEVTLHEGQNREIRRMLARVGLKVRRLRRIGIGPLQLKRLAVGQWRPLEPKEIKALQRSVATPAPGSTPGVAPAPGAKQGAPEDEA